MKQKRKVKSLISLKGESNVLLTVLLFLLGGILCFGAITLFTSSVGVEAAGSEVTYEGIDDEVEVIFDLSLTPEDNLRKVVTNMYLTAGGTFYMSGNVINSSPTHSLSGKVYILGGENMNIASDNIAVIGGNSNEVYENNPNTAILGGEHNKVSEGNNSQNAAILLGGDHNTIGTNQDSNAIVGGNHNEIGDNVTNGYILGGENNVISDDVSNVIVGGKGVTVNSLSDVFVFSDGRSFSPQSSNAFYLYVAKGLGLGMTTNAGGVASKGPISFGEIGDERCTSNNIGVQGSLNGCLVGCTQAGVNTGGRWELIDHGDGCENVCKNDHPDKCVVYVVEPEPKPSYVSKCTVGNVDTGNSVHCASNLLDNYENVVFETKLIDSEDFCPNPDSVEDKCVFICEPNYHLTGDKAGGTNIQKCYSDCELPWGGVLKHNEKVVAYNAEVVNCSNDSYRFPQNTAIVNVPTTVWATNKLETISGMKKVKKAYGISYESCAGTATNRNYTHQKTLICNNGTLYIANGNKATTTKALGGAGARYEYNTCRMESYGCNTTVYNLTEAQIRERDQGVNFDKNTDRGQGTNGTRGVYELCLDWNATAGNITSCSKGGEHYRLAKCKDGYATGVDHPYECKKKCDFDGKTGKNGYKHGTTITAYRAESVTCPDRCDATQLTCDDGTWIGDYQHYTQDNCVQNKFTCEGYGVTPAIWGTHNGVDARYDECQKLKSNGINTADCIGDGKAYKLTECIGENHHNDDRTFCVSNSKKVRCDPTGVTLGYGEEIDLKLVRQYWVGAWDDSDGWGSVQKCGTKCDSNHHGEPGSCVDNCSVNDCDGYTETSTPSDPNRKYDDCTIKYADCTDGATKYKYYNDCYSPYTWDGTKCVEPVTCTPNDCNGYTESSTPSDPNRKYDDCDIVNDDCTPGGRVYKYYNDCYSPYIWNGSACVLGDEDCGGTPPEGDQYVLGSSTYTYGYTPSSWTRVGDTTDPGACQWRCNTSAGYTWNGSDCKKPPITYSCSRDEPNKCEGSDGSLVDGTPTSHENNVYEWECEAGDGSTTVCVLCDEDSPRVGQQPDPEEGCGNSISTQEVSCGTAPTNAYWVNGNFTQTCDRYDCAPVSKAPTYTSDSSVECSYQCGNGSTRDGNKCIINGGCGELEQCGECARGSVADYETNWSEDESRCEWTCKGSNGGTDEFCSMVLSCNNTCGYDGGSECDAAYGNGSYGENRCSYETTSYDCEAVGYISCSQWPTHELCNSDRSNYEPIKVPIGFPGGIVQTHMYHGSCCSWNQGAVCKLNGVESDLDLCDSLVPPSNCEEAFY